MYDEGGPDSVFLEPLNDQLVSRDGRRHLIAAQIGLIPDEIRQDISMYWTEPHEVDSDATPTQHVEQIRAQMLPMEAELAQLQGRITPEGKALVDRVLGAPTWGDRQAAFQAGERPGVYAVHQQGTLRETPGPRFAGMFVITGSDRSTADQPGGSDTLSTRDDAGKAILYSPEHGFEEFSHIWLLAHQLGARLRNPPEHAALAKHLPRSAAHPGSRMAIDRRFTAIKEHVITDSFQSQLQKQAQDVDHAFKIRPASPISLSALVERLDAASALHLQAGAGQQRAVRTQSDAAGVRGTQSADQPHRAGTPGVQTPARLSPVDWDAAATPEPMPDTGVDAADIQQQDVFDAFAEEALKDFDETRDAILSVPDYIHRFIDDGIKRYEAKTGTSTGLGPWSMIPVTYNERPPAKPIAQRIRKISKTVNFRLNEIIRGQHLFDTVRYGGDLRIARIGHQQVIDEISRPDLGASMSAALDAFRNDAARTQNLKAYYADMMRLRALAYLDTPDAPHAGEVRAFLEDRSQAKTVSFSGYPLNGVFFVPTGEKSGLLFSVDDERFFEVKQRHHGHHQAYKWVNTLVADFPQDDDFRNWMLERLSFYAAQDVSSASLAPKMTPKSPITGWYNEGKIYSDPFGLEAVASQRELVDKLYQQQLDRVASDIDSMVFSRKEQFTREWIEQGSKIIGLSLLALPAVSVAAATPMVRGLAAAATVAATGLDLAASAFLAATEDRARFAAARRRDVILQAIMSAPAVLLASWSSKKQLFSPRSIMQGLALYRDASAVVRARMPEFMMRRLWGTMSTPARTTALLGAVRDSNAARELASLTSQRAVDQSIRNNLLLDFEGAAHTPNFGPFALERAKAQQRVSLEVARLKDANAHMAQLRNTFVAADLAVQAGPPERAAAAWVLSNSTSASTTAQKILDVFATFKDADLTDPATIDEIRRAVYVPPPGHALREFRPSNTRLFMGTDVAREGYMRALQDIRNAPEHLPEKLFAATIRYHPYGDGNGRTARVLYALARLKEGPAAFAALTPAGEQALINLP